MSVKNRIRQQALDEVEFAKHTETPSGSQLVMLSALVKAVIYVGDAIREAARVTTDTKEQS